ncbi:uncharacterized protein BKCO1_19000173 [Diplodia corticola]|uniref:Uncharacterized protein n=1 Tax=Diplodia corticola TaxID=236234 RepID=A0A1J9S4U8_9PEZI|nr:uncharacterized protein BKCO1_19000173 [Diplodia corticola]OJD34980.1 hypothetical protein BKCO1_19000173 [Diplodia corticola]
MPPPPPQQPNPPPRPQQQQPATATTTSSTTNTRGSADDVRRFRDGDEASLAVEERGQLVRAAFVVRRARLDPRGSGRWQYQLWREPDGTPFEAGRWVGEGELS